MAQQRDRTSSIISAVIGGTIATIACFIFFTYFGKRDTPVEAQPSPTPIATASPAATPPREMPNPDIKPEDVSELSISTVYKGYFDPANRCSKTYTEYFGNDDGVASSSSPCNLKIVFERGGSAKRTITVMRWDKAAKENRVFEKSESTAVINTEQFNSLAAAITSNQAFKEWNNGIMINVSNCTVSVKHTGGTKSPMSNVDERTTAFLPMVEAFKQVEKQLTWNLVK